MPEIQSISIIIPAYNEENNLRTCIHVIHKYLTKLIGTNFEILIVENGSTDRTAYIARKLEDMVADSSQVEHNFLNRKGAILVQ